MGEAFSSPMTVQVVEGDVVILGPDAIAVSMTPAAAEESAQRLLNAAALARSANQPQYEE